MNKISSIKSIILTSIQFGLVEITLTIIFINGIVVMKYPLLLFLGGYIFIIVTQVSIQDITIINNTVMQLTSLFNKKYYDINILHIYSIHIGRSAFIISSNRGKFNIYFSQANYDEIKLLLRITKNQQIAELLRKKMAFRNLF
jgi:hypothetical protein